MLFAMEMPEPEAPPRAARKSPAAAPPKSELDPADEGGPPTQTDRRSYEPSGAEAIERILADLTEAQREAVVHTDGALLILAGPGSGKTRVVTRRAAHLALTVADARQILAITFTNKAAREMGARIDALGVAHGMTVSTFHAFCAALLRRYADRAGIPRNFTIFDRDDRRSLLKAAIEACGFANSGYTPASAEQEISALKSKMISPVRLREQSGDWRAQMLLPIYEQYEASLAQMGGLDFDDLLLRVADLLESDDDLRSRLEERYRYVLVDEYQDTNACQYKIARLLTRQRGNLCATGDPDQSIYGWRGADIGNILSFERDYPQAKVVRLEQNYRSTKRILALADHLIAGNLRRKAKTLWTENETGATVRVLEFETAQEEAAAVAGDIARQIRAGARADGMAVFYRVNSLSRVIEDELRAAGIPYQIARGVEFYGRKEIKDALAYLRVLVNPADEVSLVRIINTPSRGIGTTTIERLIAAARTKQACVLDALNDTDLVGSLGRSAAKLHEFAALLRKLAAALEMPPRSAVEHVISHSGLRALYGESRDAEDSPAANLDELISAAAAFEDTHPESKLLDWLEHAALVSDVDAVEEDSRKVTLMTLHAAKGLEFDSVHLIGMENGLLPFRREDGGHSRCDIEEERRLCFVGITRAKKRLTLSLARYRMMRGGAVRTTRSPFLDGLPPGLIECPASQADSPSANRPVDRGRLPRDIEHWMVGTLVRHPNHGLGQVTEIERGPSRTHVRVRFRDGLTRAYALEFSDLQRVEFDEVGE